MKKIFGALWRFLWKTIMWFFIISFATTLLFRFVPIPFTPLMLIRLVEQATGDRKIRLTKDWVALKEISPNLPLAAMASEDQQFTEHHGFDIDAIEKALKHNERSKRIRGASTISQQTAKNVFLWPGRSWVRKGFEVYFTALIELLWQKERIMEVYLNVIEMGDGIYGAEAAAQSYFHKHAMSLAPGEAALIAATLPNPLKLSPAKPSSYILKRKQWILRQMGNIRELRIKN